MSTYNNIYIAYNRAVTARSEAVWKLLAESERNLLISAQENDEAKEAFRNYLLWLVFKFPGWYEASMEVMFQYIARKTNKFEISYENADELAPILRKEFEGNRNGRFLISISDGLCDSLLKVDGDSAVETNNYPNGIRGYVDAVLWNGWLKEYSAFERKNSKASPLDKWRVLLSACDEQALQGKKCQKYWPKLAPYKIWKENLAPLICPRKME